MSAVAPYSAHALSLSAVRPNLSAPSSEARSQQAAIRAGYGAKTAEASRAREAQAAKPTAVMRFGRPQLAYSDRPVMAACGKSRSEWPKECADSCRSPPPSIRLYKSVQLFSCSSGLPLSLAAPPASSSRACQPSAIRFPAARVGSTKSSTMATASSVAARATACACSAGVATTGPSACR
jgi:hypothetical protein